MNRRNPSGALHAIAQTLKDVSCIDRDPDPDILEKRIELHQREIENAIHRHRLEFGFPDCRLSEILPKLCAAMGEELRELRPTTRFLNTSTGEGGRRPVVDRATRIAHLQAYGDWLAEIIERFAMRVDEADAFHAKPFEWFNDRRAGKYRSESSAIIESKAGIAGLRIPIEETTTQLEPGIESRTQPESLPPRETLPPKAKRAIVHWFRWNEENEERATTQREYIGRDRGLREDPPDFERGRKLFNEGWRLDNNEEPYQDASLAKSKNRKSKPERRNS